MDGKLFYQYFTGEHEFKPIQPCSPTELVNFRNRIGKNGIELIFKEAIRVNGKDSNEKDIIADTTVQEKNITFPTDSKLHCKIKEKCVKIAKKRGGRIKTKLLTHITKTAIQTKKSK